MQPRRVETEAEGVEARRDGEGRELCLHREISKDNPERICEVQECCSLMLCLMRWKRKCVVREG